VTYREGVSGEYEISILNMPRHWGRKNNNLGSCILYTLYFIFDNLYVAMTTIAAHHVKIQLWWIGLIFFYYFCLKSRKLFPMSALR
jgi:hypothetical protein